MPDWVTPTLVLPTREYSEPLNYTLLYVFVFVFVFVFVSDFVFVFVSDFVFVYVFVFVFVVPMGMSQAGYLAVWVTSSPAALIPTTVA